MSESKSDGGPAYPVADMSKTQCAGMSLRDWFAGMAMQGLAENILCDQKTEDVFIAGGGKAEELGDFLAFLSYGVADAMLKAREQ